MSNPITININISLTIDKEGNVTVNGSTADVERIDLDDNKRNIMPNDNDRNIINTGPTTGDPYPGMDTTTICTTTSDLPMTISDESSSGLCTTTAFTNYGSGSNFSGEFIHPSEGQHTPSLKSDKEARQQYYMTLDNKAADSDDTMSSTSGVMSPLENLNMEMKFAKVIGTTLGY